VAGVSVKKRHETERVSLTEAVVVILAIALAGAAGWYLLTLGKTTQQDGENNIGIELGQTAPDFTLTDIDGVAFSLSDYRDNIVVIDFMATWCGPCVVEMGHLKQLYTNYGAQGVVIMSIDVDPSETNEVIRQFKVSYGDDWIFASGPSVGTTYRVIYIPTLYIIDQQGRVAYKNVGVTTYSTLAAEVDKLL
jgi:peroxiredoxin